MKPIARLFAFLAPVCLAGCAAQVSPTGASIGPAVAIPIGGVVSPAPSAGPVVGPAYGPGEDQHWFQQDDYLIADRPYEKGYIYVKLAKMKQAPSPATRDEAQFFVLAETKDQWTKYFYLTRPVTQADLVLGAMVICYEGNLGEGGIYREPRKRESARTGAWFMSRITDLAELYKQSVGVDTYKCSPSALRVPVR
jgi:hypothetical protein